MAKREEGKSITWVVTASAIVVAVLGWGILANSYVSATRPEDIQLDPEAMQRFGSSRGARKVGAIVALVDGIVDFTVNSVTQIPRLVTVFVWHFENRLWLPLVIVVVEGAVVAGGVGMKKLEQHLADPLAPPQKKSKPKRKKTARRKATEPPAERPRRKRPDAERRKRPRAE